jgi:hypothetical protein
MRDGCGHNDSFIEYGRLCEQIIVVLPSWRLDVRQPNRVSSRAQAEASPRCPGTGRRIQDGFLDEASNHYEDSFSGLTSGNSHLWIRRAQHRIYRRSGWFIYVAFRKQLGLKRSNALHVTFTRGLTLANDWADPTATGQFKSLSSPVVSNEFSVHDCGPFELLTLS